MPLPKHLYRVLRENEDPKQGLVATYPDANIMVVQHIMGQEKSQFISTTATLEAAEMFAGLAKKKYPKRKIRMVKIDVDELKKEKNVKIIDLTDPQILDIHLEKKAKMARNWAKKYKEVLVEGKIPARCVALIESDDFAVKLSGFNIIFILVAIVMIIVEIVTKRHCKLRRPAIPRILFPHSINLRNSFKDLTVLV